MYPHSAMVGGGTRDYYSNEIARDHLSLVRAGRRIPLVVRVAAILGRRNVGREEVVARGTGTPTAPVSPEATT